MTTRVLAGCKSKDEKTVCIRAKETKGRRSGERPFTDSITKTASPKNPSFELKNNLFILPNQPPTLSYGDDFLFLFK